MRQCSVALVFICIITSSLYAQGNWELMFPSPTSNQMVGMYFIDSQNGWSVGEYGTILKTTDGGENWTIQEIPWLFDLCDVHFPTMLTGYAIGTDGFIIKTTDGGESWEQLDNHYSNNLNRILFRDENNGWTIGEKGLILHSSDGGGTWTQQPIDNPFITLNGIDLIGADGIIVVGEQSIILMTHDDGQNWQIIPDDPISAYLYSFEDVYFVDELHGWIGGGTGQHTALQKTVDGGQTWTQLNHREYRFTDYFGTTTGLWLGPLQQIYFYDDMKRGIGLFKTSYATDYGNIPMLTGNTGTYWGGEINGKREHYDGRGRFCILDENKIICTGFQGDFRFSNNRGSTWYLTAQEQRWWRYLTIGNNGQLLVHRNCIRAYHSRGDIDQSIRSSDYGNTWSEFGPEYLDRNNQPFYPRHFPGFGQFIDNRDTLWLPIYIQADTANAIFISTDFGLTYKEIRRGSDYSVNIFLTPDTMISYRIDAIQPAPGRYEELFRFNYSFDGGITVNTFTSEDLWNFLISWPAGLGSISTHYFFNGHKGFLIGSDGNIVMTEDTGQSWTNIYSGIVEDLYDITFIDEHTGFVVGDFGRILKTDDGGMTWRKTNSGTQEIIYSIGFINDHEGWVGTENGLRYTTDAGESWQGVPLRYSHGKFENLEFDDAGNGYAYTLYNEYLNTHEHNRPFSYMQLMRMTNREIGIDESNFKALVPRAIKLSQNYPNPFNATTRIKYHLPVHTTVNLTIYNIKGQIIRTLVNQPQKAGDYSLLWDGRSSDGNSVASGIYLYKLQTNNQIASRKLLLLR